MSYFLQIFCCKNINLFLMRPVSEVINSRSWQKKNSNSSEPSIGELCQSTELPTTSNITLIVHFPSYLWFPWLITWLVLRCTTTSLIPHVNSYVTDLSQGSQVTGSSSCERGNTSNEVSQMLSSRWWLSVSSKSTASRITEAIVNVLWPCVLMADRSRSAVQILFKYVKLMNHWWLIR